MKILVVSDSHGEVELLNKLFFKYQNFDTFLHLGDSQLSETYLNNYLCVKGNCDFFSSFPKERDIVKNNIKIHLEHGHRINWYNIETYLNLIGNPNIFLFGHTHQKFVQQIGDTLFLNPGSLTRPRDGNEGSYLIIEINDDKISYEFRNILDEKLEL